MIPSEATVLSPPSRNFPKSRRLLRPSEFRFRPFFTFATDRFCFYFTRRGEGRLGVTLSKKALPKSVARNRVRRLVREVFRREPGGFAGVDVNVVGRRGLRDEWKALSRQAIELDFGAFKAHLGRRNQGQKR